MTFVADGNLALDVYLGIRLSATTKTVWNQDRNQFFLYLFLGSRLSATTGTKWNQDRNQAIPYVFLGNHFFATTGTKWNQDRIQPIPYVFMGNDVSSRTPIIILIKSPDSRNQGPQNGIHCRILPGGGGGNTLRNQFYDAQQIPS